MTSGVGVAVTIGVSVTLGILVGVGEGLLVGVAVGSSGVEVDVGVGDGFSFVFFLQPFFDIKKGNLFILEITIPHLMQLSLLSKYLFKSQNPPSLPVLGMVELKLYQK